RHRGGAVRRPGLQPLPGRGTAGDPGRHRPGGRPAHGAGAVLRAGRAVRADVGAGLMAIDLPPPPLQPAAMAMAPVISAALTDTSVQVKSDFRGARIVLYGAVFDLAG